MRLVTFAAKPGQARLGGLIAQHVVDLPGAHAASGASKDTVPTSMLDLLRGGEGAKQAAQGVIDFAAKNLTTLARANLAYPISDVTFLPPIPRPGKIICIGQNYRRHVAEMKRELPKFPTLFAKFSNTLIGHRQPIVLPRVSNMADWEGELAIVIGRAGKDIAPKDAFNYIAGYAIFNDVSIRDFQYRTQQWLQGKTFDGAGPMGPALVTADEVSDPQNLDLATRVNGQVMQEANTSDFIFDIPTTINYISQILTLEPGDIVATGTPGGVGYARDPQIFLKPGDVVQVEISELGVLENPVVAPRAESKNG